MNRLLLLFFVSFMPNSYAELIFESSIGPFDSTVCCGSSVSHTQFIGSIFKLKEQTHINGIGGHFSKLSGGAIFGAIVKLGNDGLPIGTLTDLENTIAHVVFTPKSGTDTLKPISVTLPPGTYGLIFGSGLFGANGSSNLTLLQRSDTFTSDGHIVSLNKSSAVDWRLSNDGPSRYRMFVSADIGVFSKAHWGNNYLFILLGECYDLTKRKSDLYGKDKNGQKTLSFKVLKKSFNLLIFNYLEEGDHFNRLTEWDKRKLKKIDISTSEYQALDMCVKKFMEEYTPSTFRQKLIENNS